MPEDSFNVPLLGTPFSSDVPIVLCETDTMIAQIRTVAHIIQEVEESTCVIVTPCINVVHGIFGHFSYKELDNAHVQYLPGVCRHLLSLSRLLLRLCTFPFSPILLLACLRPLGFWKVRMRQVIARAEFIIRTHRCFTYADLVHVLARESTERVDTSPKVSDDCWHDAIALLYTACSLYEREAHISEDLSHASAATCHLQLLEHWLQLGGCCDNGIDVEQQYIILRDYILQLAQCWEPYRSYSSNFEILFRNMCIEHAFIPPRYRFFYPGYLSDLPQKPVGCIILCELNDDMWRDYAPDESFITRFLPYFSRNFAKKVYCTRQRLSRNPTPLWFWTALQGLRERAPHVVTRAPMCLLHTAQCCEFLRSMHMRNTDETHVPHGPSARGSVCAHLPHPLTSYVRMLSIHAIHYLQHNPYAFYAKYILRLSPLPALSALPQSDRYQDFLRRFLRAFLTRNEIISGTLPEGAFLRIGDTTVEETCGSTYMVGFYKKRIRSFLRALYPWHAAMSVLGDVHVFVESVCPIMRDLFVRVHVDHVVTGTEYACYVADYGSMTSYVARDVRDCEDIRLVLRALALEKGTASRKQPHEVRKIDYLDSRGSAYRFHTIAAQRQEVESLYAQLLEKLRSILLPYVTNDTFYHWNRDRYTLGSDYEHMARVL